MNQDTIKLLQSLGEKLGVTGAYLWGVLVHGTYVAGVINLVWAGGLFVAIGLILFVMVKMNKHYNDKITKSTYYDDDDHASRAANAIIGLILVGIFSIAFLVNAFNGMSRVFNPEYETVHEVLDSIKSSK